MNKLFYFKDLDDHYVINIAGIHLSIKHKMKFKYQKAVSWGLNEDKRTPQLLVSLTTHPARINYVHYTINTLLTQKLKPDKIILWLAYQQFPNLEKDLPDTLLKLKDLGLTIDWCEDLKSYKKLIPTLRKYPDDIIVTTDDDVYYEPDLLEHLYNAYLKDKTNIYARRSVKLELINNEVCGIPSRKYGYKSDLHPAYFNQQIGMYGCLYPPHSLYKDITNTEQILKTLPTHDDAYFWCMAVLNKTKIQVIDGFNSNAHLVANTQEYALKNINKKNNTGIALEDAYKVMIKEYPEILKILKGECETEREVLL